MKKGGAAVAVLAAGMLLWVLGMSANQGGTTQTDGWTAVPTSQVPAVGTFYLMTTASNGHPVPPYPANVTGSTNIYTFGDSGIFIVDDRTQRPNMLLDASWATFRQTIALGWIDGQVQMESDQIATAANRII